MMYMRQHVDDHGNIDALTLGVLLVFLKDSWCQSSRESCIPMGLERKTADCILDLPYSWFIANYVRVVRGAQHFFHADRMGKPLVPNDDILDMTIHVISGLPSRLQHSLIAPHQILAIGEDHKSPERGNSVVGPVPLALRT